ncbi:BlaI/MecI/CopY family transcriptional regulator [Gilvimarinus xylanilyticus]|uniref:BlaI/MecI/CopY family transcriptional regulator n=1 Tax=Gilvimarinus xylanilyticus TaxID=2944139 RepID=A0A9X2KUY6_9GAMM|nr:BlaI/MecI/CopY family transcriptional regulator [Gilvimarinus xylanilyticus]MCP8900358.1 BlaI/MecI/CopY family transcriptional regulator [Gilvimarinus xylanilyticus]
MKRPTQSEWEILSILWAEKEATAQTVNDRLNQHKQVSYTGTLKLMQLMHQKGLLERERVGRSHVYRPLIEESDAKSSLLDNVVQSTFGGSASNLVMSLLGNKKVSRREIDDIRAFLDDLEDKQ